MASITDSKRIAKNTLFLYLRMIILVIIQLYTVPIVLNSLGAVDYGLYNVVGGIVTMFTFISGALASGSQRFLAYSIGENNLESVKKVFDSTVTLYIVFLAILLVVAEVIGVWFLNTKMQIPTDRLFAANCVFQFSVASFLICLISVPYYSDIVAHEKMSIFAYISIIDGVLKLMAAIMLKYMVGDLLIVYSSFICAISLFVFFIYLFYCKRYFFECRHFNFSWDNEIGKSLLSYSGWNMIGSLALIARNQGINIVVNLFFGPIINAAHSIAQQVSGLVTQLVNNVYLATRPQITKLYAKKEKESMWSLVYSSSKWTYYLLMIISIPAILEMESILSLWLNEVPPYTVAMTKLLILSVLLETTVNQIVGAFQAENRIKKYQLASSTILLLNIPVSYILLKTGMVDVITPYIVTCILSLMYVVSLLIVSKVELEMDVLYYIRCIISRMIVVSIIVFICVFLIYDILPPSFCRILLTCFESVLISIICIWLFGMDNKERVLVKNKIKMILNY